MTSVGEHIGSLNWGYRVALRDASVKYINARGQFTGPHTLSCTDKKGKVWGTLGANRMQQERL